MSRRCEACGQALPERRRDPPLAPLDQPAVVTIHDLSEDERASVEVVVGMSGTHQLRRADA